MGGQISPNGSESINLNLVEKLTVGVDQAWVRLPDLITKRCEICEYSWLMQHCSRRQLGCAIVKNKEGHLGIVVVGGSGDDAAVETSVEYLDLSAPGASWQSWPSLTTPRCCWPQVSIIFIFTKSIVVSQRLECWKIILLLLGERRDHLILSRVLIPRSDHEILLSHVLCVLITRLDSGHRVDTN